MLGFLRPFVLVTIIGYGVVSATAEELLVTELVSIGHRTPMQLLPILAPLVPAPGSLSAANDHLIVTTTRSNLRQIKAILAALDRPLKNLLVSIRYADSGAEERTEGRASVSIGAGQRPLSSVFPDPYETHAETARKRNRLEDSRATVRLWRTEATSGSRREQQLRVLDGAPACISRGKLAPVGAQSVLFIDGALLGVEATTAYVNLNTGFCVVPHVRGDQVLLDIAPQTAHASLGDSGTVETGAIRTMVSVPLGRWIEIGHIGQRDHQRQNRGLYVSTKSSEAVLIKVDDVSP